MTSQNHAIHSVRPSQSSLLIATMLCLLLTALLAAIIF